MSKLQDVMAQLNKKHKGALVGSVAEVPRESGGISFGLTGLDRMFKTRGVPRGRITQIVAEQNAGKSTLAMGAISALHTAVDAGREKRGMVLFIDTERTFDEDYARQLGVQVDDPAKFLLMRPDDGIEAIDAIEKLIDTGELDLVVLDSITFLIPREETCPFALARVPPALQKPRERCYRESPCVARRFSDGLRPSPH